MALAEELTAQLENKIENKPNGNKVKLTDIYIAAYKRGPVRREITFRADSQEHAEVLFARYIKMQKAIENEKVVALGFPKPLALDIEVELDKFYKETGRKF